MDNFTDLLTYLLSLGTLVADVFIIYLAFLLATKNPLPDFLKNLFEKYWLKLCFLIAFTATLSSLYYSEIAGFEPCVLCWYQRIFMMPLVFLIGLAIYKKETIIKPYVKLMCVVGSLIAIYHYLLQMGVTTIAPCDAVINGSSACAQMPFISFDYITIPIMSLTAFLLILIIMKFGTENKK